MSIDRNLTRRTFLRASAVGLGAAALASPVRRSTAAAEGGTLQVYWNAGHAYDGYKQVIAQFEQDHPGWKVNLQLFQWPDMRTKILADFAAGNPPDLMEEPGGWVQDFATAGTIRSLQPYVDQDGEAMGFPSDWQPYAVERDTFSGEVYGIQLHLTCALLFYNKDMFSQAGIAEPPKTWEEFVAAAKATSKGNVFGFAPNQSADYAWYWLFQNDVGIYDPEKNVVPMDNDAAYEAMQFQADLIHKDKVAPIPIAAADYEGPQKLFSAQRAAMIVTGPWDIKPILDGSPDLNWGIAQASTHKVQATFSAGTSMMIPKDAKQPDLAWDLIKRLTNPDVELAVTKEANQTMPRKSWGDLPEVKALERVAPFTQGLTYARDLYAGLRLTGHFGEINDLFTKAYQDILYRNLAASDVLKDFAEQSNKILAG
ncbi:MAG TPA: sugar ABC transporter substrate-binding protein [Thermomicrobiales bacterium]|nr:sugar ABC transporter substrate-binding protein [Thermomicrobiales bacterium]